MSARHLKQLPELLVEEGLLSVAQLEEASISQQKHRQSLSRVLIDSGLITEAALVSTIAKHIGLPFVDLNEYPIDPSAASLIPENVTKRQGVLPIAFEGSKIVVAMSDPGNIIAIDDIRTITKMEVRPVIATKSDILAASARLSRMDQQVEDIAAEAAGETDSGEDLARLREVVEDAPIVKLVNLLITQAVNERASDIHIEPGEKDVRVRFRIDGVLHEMMRSPKSLQSGVISRLKIMADINIAERRVPQDGRVGLVIGGKGIDLRVATLPTVHGEKVVLRILDKSSILLKLSDLGFSQHNYERYEASYRKPYGMILVTGPTGSGKSTTLYATLNILNTTDRNTITVEDPVEYRLAGINQVQINQKAGLTFASALRSILRSDPDVVLIGEIRDRETAQIAIEAALTGHLVLSTLHTNDAPSAISRLVEMGVEPFLVSSSIDAVLAQRLVRKLCDKCKEPYEATPEMLAESRIPIPSDMQSVTLFKAVGCSSCSKTGYRGRMAVHEVMTMSEEIERLTAEHRSSDEIGAMARSQGMQTLRDDGVLKALEGKTSIEELLRVIV
ncbi:MAG: GspE/PulE family protein [Actinomycetota bacterium]